MAIRWLRPRAVGGVPDDGLDAPELEEGGLGESGWARFLDNRAAVISSVLFLALAVLAWVAPWIGLADPIEQHYGDEFLPPDATYWFGTDDFGRDLFSRCIWGMRLSLAIGLLAAAVAGVVGTMLGMIQGYLRGWLDDFLGRIWDTLLAFPGLLLGLAVAVFLGEGSVNAAVAAAVANVPIIGRLARATVLGEQEKGYVMAVRAAGARTERILTMHLFPNVFPIVSVQVTLTVAHAMILEAGLSFLGIGAQPPYPSLGGMLRDARTFMNDAVWYAIFPGLSLTILLLLITFISDGLADAFDPRRSTRAGR
jgi:peptide/nickel transport system permease protein